jgi:hypothetical protein
MGEKIVPSSQGSPLGACRGEVGMRHFEIWTVRPGTVATKGRPG